MISFLINFTYLLLILFVVFIIIAIIYKPFSIYKNHPEQQNPMEGKNVVFVYDENDKENADGVKGHLVIRGDSNKRFGLYETIIKRALDIVLSFFGLVIFSPVFLVISIAIIIDDQGPVFFVQKRVGRNKQYFKLHKFRSMKVSAPADVPTHMLTNSKQHLTKVGKFIRAHSLDELPQIWDIFIGNMSIVGPRPVLWNLNSLIAERDKYGANDVRPGLTGLAQINGRDLLSIQDKAKFDGLYVKNISFVTDLKCLLGTLHVLIKDDSIVEDGNC